MTVNDRYLICTVEGRLNSLLDVNGGISKRKVCILLSFALYIYFNYRLGLNIFY